MYFSFDFGWYSIHLCPLKTGVGGWGGGGGFFLLNRQNPLSVTKAICLRSLIALSCLHSISNKLNGVNINSLI